MRKGHFHPSNSVIVISGKKHISLNSNLLSKCHTQYISQPKKNQFCSESIHSIRGKLKLQQSLKAPKRLLHFQKHKYETNPIAHNDYINFCTSYQQTQKPKANSQLSHRIRCKSAFTKNVKNENPEITNVQNKRSNLLGTEAFVPYKIQQKKYGKPNNCKPHRTLVNNYQSKTKKAQIQRPPPEIGINRWEQASEQLSYLALLIK